MLRASLVGLLVVMASLPLLFWIHGHFELGAPPVSGLILLGLGVIVACAGGAWFGWALAQWWGGRASGTLAALGGFVWGILLAFWIGSSYGALVTEAATREATLAAIANRERIAQAARETVEQATNGHSSKDAIDASVAFSDDATIVALRGAAKLPAMGLLFWALLAPPFLSAWECRRARD